MARSTRLALGLVVGLAALTWAAWAFVHRTTDAWHQKDVALRAALAVNGARSGLVQHWEHPLELTGVLTDIARDERIMGAEACALDWSTRGKSRDFPELASCAQLSARIGEGTAALRTGHSMTTELPGGDVHVALVPVESETGLLGAVVLVQDLAFMSRREATAQRFLLAAFALLAAAASALTFVASRYSWRRWNRELTQQLHGAAPRPEFRPLLRDVRAFMDKILSAREAELEAGSWTADRLKQTLRRHLQGERIVVVANREPYIHQKSPDGQVIVQHPASGLVTALEPVMRACSGVWVAHGSGSADRDTVDEHDRVRVPPGEESYQIRRVWLSSQEEQGYYYGFSNEGLWPLCHIAHTRPQFRAEDFAQYTAVNQKFADALAGEVDSDDPIVLVQDYHFALAPRMIREKLPRATVITFWHIPWPNSERFGICPWNKELLDGLLGSSILGFHTQGDCNNFFDGVDRYLEARIDREHSAVVRHGRRTLVRPYPISIEWPLHHLEGLPSPEGCRREVFEELGLSKDALLGVGVDRIDYTKGIEERLLAVERALEKHPEYRGRYSFVQLGAPSRTAIERYRQLNEGVESVAARINERFGTGSYRPIILLKAHHEPPRVLRFLRAADLCYVSSLHDGMNLVAKEFVAAREDERGVLILSRFTGAARELPEALIVNPYDAEEAGAAMVAALVMPLEEQRERMRSMRAFVSEFNVYRWAGRMLSDAARLRRRERLRLGLELADEAVA